MARNGVFDSDDSQIPEQPAGSAGRQPRRAYSDSDIPPRPQHRLSPIAEIMSGETQRIAEEARQQEELHELLKNGERIVKLDPKLIDEQFLEDRMIVKTEKFAEFVEEIRTKGQHQPILVRPHPTIPGRYQLTFGRRRKLACEELNRDVLALVKDQTDEELVIAQGQENALRADLSFIERARFAYNLEHSKYSRDVISSALGIDASGISRMLTIYSQIPPAIIAAIGPAPETGRPRWIELANLLVEKNAKKKALAFIESQIFASGNSDERFSALFGYLREKAPAQSSSPEQWFAKDGTRAARIIQSVGRTTISFDDKAAKDFGAFVKARLEDLYTEYKKSLGQ